MKVIMKDDRKVVDVAYDLAERLIEQGKAALAPVEEKKAETASAPEKDSAGAKKK